MVNISFTANDNAQHRFYVDVAGTATYCDTGDVCTGTFNMTSPTQRRWGPGIIHVGTYNYYDALHQATTNGTLIVQPGPYPATAKINLIASTNGWNNSQPSGPNPTITIYWVQNVRINYTSTDPPTVYHQLYIDIDHNGLPDCSGADYCGPSYHSGTTTISYWGGSWNAIPPGTYHYYDINYPSVSNGTFIVLAPTPDYFVSTSPNQLTIPQGKSQTSTITVTSINNYTGTIALTSSSSGVTATINPTQIAPAKNGIATSTINITAPVSLAPGTYSVTITGSNGTTQRSTTLNVQVTSPDFTFSRSANTITIIQGASSQATITITSQNGFSGKVSLKDLITLNGPIVSQNPTIVTISPVGSQTSTLNVTTTPTTATGSYTITVTGNSTGTNGPLTHTLTIMLNISPPPQPPPTSPSNQIFSTFFFEIITAIILATSLAIVLAKHRSTKHKSRGL